MRCGFCFVQLYFHSQQFWFRVDFYFVYCTISFSTIFPFTILTIRLSGNEEEEKKNTESINSNGIWFWMEHCTTNRLFPSHFMKIIRLKHSLCCLHLILVYIFYFLFGNDKNSNCSEWTWWQEKWAIIASKCFGCTFFYPVLLSGRLIMLAVVIDRISHLFQIEDKNEISAKSDIKMTIKERIKPYMYTKCIFLVKK